MIERIKKIMFDNNLSAARFADKIGVPKSGLSHILSGRNNPSLDYISKILEAFPNVDSEWLILGRDKKSKSIQNDIPAQTKSGLQEKLMNFNKKIGTQAGSLSDKWTNKPTETAQIQEEIMEEPELEDSNSVEDEEQISYNPKPRRIKNEKPTSIQDIGSQIERIVIFYTNGKFKEYTP